MLFRVVQINVCQQQICLPSTPSVRFLLECYSCGGHLHTHTRGAAPASLALDSRRKSTVSFRRFSPKTNGPNPLGTLNPSGVCRGYHERRPWDSRLSLTLNSREATLRNLAVRRPRAPLRRPHLDELVLLLAAAADLPILRL